jgi:hypothetical protein
MNSAELSVNRRGRNIIPHLIVDHFQFAYILESCRRSPHFKFTEDFKRNKIFLSLGLGRHSPLKILKAIKLNRRPKELFVHAGSNSGK